MSHLRLASAAILVLATLLSVPGDSKVPPSKGPERVEVPKDLISFDDGDTITIHWKGKPEEIVRILGIDTPEVLHLDHDIPYAQPFGDVAAGFLLGCIAASDKVELLRSGQKDPFKRTLGYVYVDGKNYSVLVIGARLAIESVSKYGDNGLPYDAAACLKAAKAAGPVPFEDPGVYRRRMRDVTKWMKANGTYPKAERK
ncbi:MAG: hypothetical protein CMJ83_02200 [Planctomycetes bacterium]|nr:hypothetical protein [Planctomycetota bacterium]